MDFGGPRENLYHRSMVEWSEVDTVLLDMDGTLIDLYFDNFLWNQRLPESGGDARHRRGGRPRASVCAYARRAAVA